MKYRFSFFGEALSTAGLFAGIALANSALVLLFGFPFQWLWNSVLPAVLKLPSLSYSQASALLGLGLLVRLTLSGVKFAIGSRK